MNAQRWLTRLISRVGERIGRGAAAIGWRVARWTVQPGPPKAWIGRLAAIAAGGWAMMRILAHQHLAAVLIGVFLIVSYREGTANTAQEAPEPETVPETAPKPESVSSPEEILLRMVLKAIGDRPGIHLAELLDHVRQILPGWAGFETQDLRDMLAAIDCPIRPQLRVGERTGIAGIHRDDAQAALDRLTHSPAV